MAYNNIIKADDPKAVELLTENLNHFEESRDYMQKVNDHYREYGTVQGCEGVDTAKAKELDSRVDDYQDAPYPGRFFNDNYEAIRRTKNNIYRLQNRPETMLKGWQFNGGEAVMNLANNRLQLMFNEKPTAEQRAVLKQNGFRFADKSKAWQRPLDYHSISAANKVDFIRPLDGRKPSDLQPRQPKRNAPER